MKVRIETDKAAAMFSCAIGDYRGLERPDALAMIESSDVSEAEAEAETIVPPAKPTAAKPRKTKS